jgi:hypothetical protein
VNRLGHAIWMPLGTVLEERGAVRNSFCSVRNKVNKYSALRLLFQVPEIRNIFNKSD